MDRCIKRYIRYRYRVRVIVQNRRLEYRLLRYIVSVKKSYIDTFYRAMLRRARYCCGMLSVCLSVCPSVCLSVRDVQVRF